MTVETKEQGFTQERLDAATDGKLRYGDLNPTERKQLDNYKQTGNIEVETVDVATSEPTIEEPKIEPPSESTELKAIKAKLFESQVEANRNKQLNEKLASDKDFIAKQLNDLKSAQVTQNTDNAYDEEYQKQLLERVNLLEGRERERLERDQTFSNQSQQEALTLNEELKLKSNFLDIKKLQHNNPELRTTADIETLDGELKAFADSVGGYDNVNKYLEDPEFKKAKDAEGLTPLSNTFMDNLDKFNKIVDLNQEFAFKKDDNGKSYSDRNPDVTIDNLYMNKLQQSGQYSDMLRNAKLTGANAVVDKVVSQKHTANTMTPASGADLPSEGMTTNTAIDIVKRLGPKIRLGQKLNAEDQESWDRYNEFIKSQYSN